MQKIYDYGNGVKEVRSISSNQNSNDIRHYKTKSKTEIVNTKTNEIITKRVSQSKYECDDVASSMLHYFRLLLYNINPVLQNGSCYFVTLTNSDMIDYYEFNNRIERYINRLKYYNNQFKYAIFKEANAEGRFHIHALFWWKENVHLDINVFLDKWKYCSDKGKDISEIRSFKELQKVLFYLSNYSTKTSNDKVRNKRNGLKYFPPNIHLVQTSSGLSEPKFELADNPLSQSTKILSQSERILPNGELFTSVFYKE